ncbi:hypothetical protein AWT69_004155 [Pseudomonas putida]|nr:hypothetical protein AWT69_004155 [Pseudomonas putida]
MFLCRRKRPEPSERRWPLRRPEAEDSAETQLMQKIISCFV